MRSDNLRAAPHWITPELVGRVLSLAMPVERKVLPVVQVPTPGVKPKLSIVPVTHSRRDREDEAATPPPAAASSSTKAPEKVERDREAERTAPCRPVEPAPSREPALHAPSPAQAPAQPISARAKIDAANKRRADATRKRILERAADLVDSGEAVTKAHGIHVVIAARQLERQRADEIRFGDPVEQAKSILRRRYAPVCSMAVHGGDARLFQVGHRKDVTQDELIAWAERVES